MNNKNYETIILPFSDGIAITIRKKQKGTYAGRVSSNTKKYRTYI